MLWVWIGALILFFYLLSFEVVRNILRWILFLPLGLVAPLVYNFLDIPGWILGTILGENIYALGLILGSIDHVIGLFLALFISKFVAPNGKVGLIIASVVCLILLCVNLVTSNSFTIYPSMGIPEPSIDWLKNGILMALTAGVMWLMISTDDED